MEFAVTANVSWRLSTIALILGLTIFAALSSNTVKAQQTFPAKKVSREHIEWCYKNHKSYRLLDNTYADSDGNRLECISPYS
ncbi:BA14K family protein [Oryzicola mucosus]|nr:BA14K family protein [Oryzicola mucosus]